jgi:acetyl-CoA C-acetyltransferase
MAVTDKETKAVSKREVTVSEDTCNRRGTTYEGLAKLAPVMGEGKFVTAGNASQLSDGASACVMMEAKEAERLGLSPLGVFRGLASPAASRTRWASAPCSPCRNCSSALA